MRTKGLRAVIRGSAVCAGVALAAYATYSCVTWLRYGQASEPRTADERDELLDRFMPVYEVRERHGVKVAAPADVTFAAAREMDLLGSPVARTIIRARELVLGAQGPHTPQPRGLLAQTQALGWGVLAETSTEVVMGAVTQPWKAEVVFRALSPDAFIAFDEPDFVKIAWTLRVDPVGTDASVFHTETRVVSTNATARATFRRYWSIFSPGIKLIRWVSLAPLKRAAERQVVRSADSLSHTSSADSQSGGP